MLQIRASYWLLLGYLLTQPALAQEPFNTYIGSLPVASSVSPSDQLYVMQGSTSTRATAAAVVGGALGVTCPSSQWVRSLNPVACSQPTYSDLSGSFPSGTTIDSPNFTGTATGTLNLATPLPVASGGTGDSSLTANAILSGNGTSPVQLISCGTAGYALIGGSPPTCQGYLSGLSNAVTRTWQDKASDFVNAKDFGVKCDSSTNDTTAISNAIAAMSPAGGTLYFPAGGCVITAGAIVISTPISIQGAGMGGTMSDPRTFSNPEGTTFLVSGAGTGLAISTGTTTRLAGMHWSDFAIVAQSGTLSSPPLYLHSANSTNGNTGGVFNSVFERINFGSTNATAYSILMDQTSCASGTSGGTRQVTFRNNFINDGVNASCMGDQVHFLNNQFGLTANACITVTQVAGAVALTVIGNNMICTGGMVIYNGGTGVPMIAFNEMEQKNNITEANKGMIDISAGVGGAIIGNSITADSGTLASGFAIYVGAGNSHVSIDHNYINYGTIQAMVKFAGTVGIFGAGNFIDNSGTLNGTLGTNYVQVPRIGSASGTAAYACFNANGQLYNNLTVPCFANSGGVHAYAAFNNSSELTQSTVTTFTSCSGVTAATVTVSAGLVTHC